MRYVVTGAAGFIGSQLLRTLVERGHDAVGWDAFTDYYDPALKEENARGLPVERVDLAEDELDLTGVDGVFHLAGQPGVRSFGDVFPVYVRQNVLASERLFAAAASAGARTVLASSSSIYGDAETYPTREDAMPRPLSPYGITKLACEHLAHAYGREFGLDARRPALLHDLRPAAAPGHGAGADGRLPRRRDAVRALRRRHAVAQLHLRRRRRRGDDPRAWSGAHRRGAVYNVGGGEEVSMLQVIETLSEISGRELEVVRAPRREGDADAHRSPTRPGSARSSGWEPRTPFAEGLEAQWRWAADRVAARMTTAAGSGARRRAGGRSRLGLAAHRAALVASGRRPRSSARSSVSCSRSPVARSGARRPSSTSASRSRRSAAGRSRASRRTRARSARSSAPSPSSKTSRTQTGIPVSKLRSSISTKELLADRARCAGSTR